MPETCTTMFQAPKNGVLSPLLPAV